MSKIESFLNGDKGLTPKELEKLGVSKEFLYNSGRFYWDGTEKVWYLDREKEKIYVHNPYCTCTRSTKP